MSKIEVNQISSQCGSTLTIGQSGDTVTLAAGATQSGFGRTGTVDWDTTAKTASFTAVSGTGYFVNTTSSAITLTLPSSPSAGDIVAFKDYAFTFATNNLTVDGNGSPIGGVDGTINPTYSTNGTSKTFIYVDGTKGWLVTNESTDTSQESNALFTVATGGTITTCGDYKIHTFTGPGTFTVTQIGNGPTNPLGGPDTSSYLVIAGGGSGAPNSGGGGAGGFREGRDITPSYTASPLVAPVGLTLTAQAYPIVVGAGGSFPGSGTPGVNSTFSTITSAGGGKGAQGCCGATGDSGGSGGGGSNNGSGSNGGAGNTPPVSPPQGNNGGGTGTAGPGFGRGGGGGAGSVGGTGTGSASTGAGGNGVTSSINGTPTTRAGGGGGGNNAGPSPGGSGGGGATSVAGTANTGGGGGGGGTGANGGSGIVIIRYKYQ